MPADKWLASEDSSFVSGDSPVVVDLYAEDIHPFPVAEGYIACDGAGNILVEIAQQGTDYGTQFTMQNGEVVSWGNSRVGKIRITHSGTDSSYRIVLIPTRREDW